jgi:hypothetical protein
MTVPKRRGSAFSESVFEIHASRQKPLDFLRERTPELERAQAFARDRRIYSAPPGGRLATVNPASRFGRPDPSVGAKIQS